LWNLGVAEECKEKFNGACAEIVDALRDCAESRV